MHENSTADSGPDELDVVYVYTWQGLDFDVNSDTSTGNPAQEWVDDRFGADAKHHRAACVELAALLGTSGFLWCTPTQFDWRHLTDDEARREWKLRVPTDEVLAYIDTAIWDACRKVGSLANLSPITKTFCQDSQVLVRSPAKDSWCASTTGRESFPIQETPPRDWTRSRGR